MAKDVLISRPETIQEVLVNATRALGATMDYREARLQAELLLAHTLETTRAGVLARLDEPISPEIAARYAGNVARRAKHEPLAYILGHQEFYGLDFYVDRRVLIPRHETEMLALLALERVRHASHTSPMIVDVGTGSGALALTLARHLPQARIMATELSPDALAVAQMNAARLRQTERVRWLQGNLLDLVDEPFDILVANLPYIPTGRLAQLPEEIRRFEPRVALDGGFDGLSVFRRLLAQLESHATSGSTAFLEISEEQGGPAVESVRRQLPHARVELHRDLEGLARVVEIRFERYTLFAPRSTKAEKKGAGG
jgi:release factor glutamine methyltransferase